MLTPRVALLAAACLSLGLLWLDSKRQKQPSLALWLPFVWLAILASRAVAAWMQPNLLPSSEAVVEGNAIDRTLLAGMIILAVAMLARRGAPAFRWIAENKALTLFFLYCALSIAWSDFPVVAAKRWSRSMGAVVVISRFCISSSISA
jgi:hypothetical protein